MSLPEQVEPTRNSRYTDLHVTINSNTTPRTRQQFGAMREAFTGLVFRDMMRPEIITRLIGRGPVDAIEVNAIGIEIAPRNGSLHTHFVMQITHRNNQFVGNTGSANRPTGLDLQAFRQRVKAYLDSRWRGSRGVMVFFQNLTSARAKNYAVKSGNTRINASEVVRESAAVVRAMEPASADPFDFLPAEFRERARAVNRRNRGIPTVEELAAQMGSTNIR